MPIYIFIDKFKGAHWVAYAEARRERANVIIWWLFEEDGIYGTSIFSFARNISIVKFNSIYIRIPTLISINDCYRSHFFFINSSLSSFFRLIIFLEHIMDDIALNCYYIDFFFFKALLYSFSISLTFYYLCM